MMESSLCALVGAVPERFHWQGDKVELSTYFAMARGVAGGNGHAGDCGHGGPATALEMTKWFDTNYHYLVPEWSAGLSFTVDTSKLLSEILEARQLGIETRPVLIGPLTLLALGKGVDGFDPFSLADKIIVAYKAVLARLVQEHIFWVQIDEPILTTDLSEDATQFFRKAYRQL